MRSVNLILDKEVQLTQWKEPLAAVFPTVWLNYSASLARREGLPEGEPNELTVQHGEPHLFILERPTTVREYEPHEVDELRSIIGEAKQFLAVDYTDEPLLLRVLDVLLQYEETGRLVVEDEQGDFVTLTAFLAAKSGRD